MNKTENVPKFPKLQFLSTTESHSLFLSDQRGMATWRVAKKEELWSVGNRGPDPVTEYEAFRKNVLSNLKAKVSCFYQTLVIHYFLNRFSIYEFGSFSDMLMLESSFNITYDV